METFSSISEFSSHSPTSPKSGTSTDTEDSTENLWELPFVVGFSNAMVVCFFRNMLQTKRKASIVWQIKKFKPLNLIAAAKPDNNPIPRRTGKNVENDAKPFASTPAQHISAVEASSEAVLQRVWTLSQFMLFRELGSWLIFLYVWITSETGIEWRVLKENTIGKITT